jgi:hypothetical protein
VNPTPYMLNQAKSTASYSLHLLLRNTDALHDVAVLRPRLNTDIDKNNCFLKLILHETSHF